MAADDVINGTDTPANDTELADNVIYYQKNAFGRNGEKDGDLIIHNLYKNCYLKEQLYPIVYEDEEEGADNNLTAATAGGARRRNLRIKWYKKHRGNNKKVPKKSKRHDLKLSDFEAF